MDVIFMIGEKNLIKVNTFLLTETTWRPHPLNKKKQDKKKKRMWVGMTPSFFCQNFSTTKFDASIMKSNFVSFPISAYKRWNSLSFKSSKILRKTNSMRIELMVRIFSGGIFFFFVGLLRKLFLKGCEDKNHESAIWGKISLCMVRIFILKDVIIFCLYFWLGRIVCNMLILLVEELFGVCPMDVAQIKGWTT